MGWKWQAANALLDEVASEFWRWARLGNTLFHCRNKAAKEYADLIGNEEAEEFPYLVVYGDDTTRLKDVWIGDHTVWPVFVFWRHWFRVVSEGS
ncbi:MAG: hypothetical protein IT207_01660 [Fimbriimonadaceae bacterium]|nr:hypothetical protein [Fimbriimonadaceae bacterium]